MSAVIKKKRCAWALQGNQAYVAYHDTRWGVPIHDDSEHFRMITLEGAQAGLSWQLILNKIEGYNVCFANFGLEEVAHFDESKVEALCEDKRIVRNRQKIRSTLQNARSMLRLQNAFGTFDNYIWGFVNYKPIINHWQHDSEVPSSTSLAQEISVELKKQGFAFVGPTIVYAYMQAVGMVNDHITTCFRHEEIIKNIASL